MGSEDAGSGIRAILRDRRQRVLQGNRLGRRAGSGAPREPWLRCLIAATLASVVTPPALAGAWPQARGEGLLITTTLVDRADGAYNASGERVDEGYFYKDEIAFYLEYGLTDTLTLVSRLAWQTVERDFAGAVDSAEGFSATELGVRRSVYRTANSVLALQGTVFLPGEGENISNQPLGDGGNAWEARALWGRSLPAGLFGDVQLGYRWRDGRFQDEARLDLTLGWQAADRWHVLVQGFSVWSAEDPRPGLPEFRQHKLQVSVGRQVGTLEYHLGAVITPAGANTIDERSVFLSVWRRF